MKFTKYLGFFIWICPHWWKLYDAEKLLLRERGIQWIRAQLQLRRNAGITILTLYNIPWNAITWMHLQLLNIFKFFIYPSGEAVNFIQAFFYTEPSKSGCFFTEYSSFPTLFTLLSKLGLYWWFISIGSSAVSLGYMSNGPVVLRKYSWRDFWLENLPKS